MSPSTSPTTEAVAKKPEKLGIDKVHSSNATGTISVEESVAEECVGQFTDSEIAISIPVSCSSSDHEPIKLKFVANVWYLNIDKISTNQDTIITVPCSAILPFPAIQAGPEECLKVYC